MRRCITVLLIACLTQVDAQPKARRDAAERMASFIAPIESEFECEITVHGQPQFDDFSGKWLVAYSASGTGCDDAVAALQREGPELNALFVRRPTLDEVQALTAGIVRTVRHSFGCHVVLQGEPRFDEASSVWIVSFRTYAGNCDGAAAELGRQGRELRILFVSKDLPRNP